MNPHHETYVPPKCAPVFVVEISHLIETDEGLCKVKTWTTGTTPGIAIRAWKRANPEAVGIETLITAGGRRRLYSKNLGLRSRRVGHHPSIAA